MLNQYRHPVPARRSFISELIADASACQPTLPPAVDPASLPAAGLRFLVAEDHDFQRRVIMQELGRIGAASVQGAADGAAALAILSARPCPVDILISDLDMPGIDGMGVIRQIGLRGIRVSVILASAHGRQLLDSVAIMSAAYGVQVLGIVQKPLTAPALQPLIRSHCDHPPEGVLQAPGLAGSMLPQEILRGLLDDEFEPFFQPKVELATGRVAGAEALARWQHPLHGVLAPGTFIETMTRHGLLDALTWTMLRKASAFQQALPEHDGPASMSVNLCVSSLATDGVAAKITGLVLEQGVDPRQVILEITETEKAGAGGEPLENLARLRMNGFGLSMDDYGTGYSSMQLLTRVPFTELKIDRSFVRQARTEAAARTVVASCIALARNLQLACVAEGVETQDDLDLLADLGCGTAQGYFFAPPMPAPAYAAWLRRWREGEAAARLGVN
jgi:EAL domain-containing protein (putative c-di-GMP-specific phosphodiesterase class I)